MSESDLLTVDCPDEAATRRLGVQLGRCITAPLVIALSGNLGAGKTRFVRAAAEGLGVANTTVNSPTFVLIHEYEGRLPVYHFDTYRLKDVDEFLELGADEYMHSAGVCFIEWAERVRETLPRDRLEIRIHSTGETSRSFELQARGVCAAAVLEVLRRRLAEIE